MLRVDPNQIKASQRLFKKFCIAQAAGLIPAEAEFITFCQLIGKNDHSDCVIFCVDMKGRPYNKRVLAEFFRPHRSDSFIIETKWSGVSWNYYDQLTPVEKLAQDLFLRNLVRGVTELN